MYESCNYVIQHSLDDVTENKGKLGHPLLSVKFRAAFDQPNDITTENEQEQEQLTSGRTRKATWKGDQKKWSEVSGAGGYSAEEEHDRPFRASFDKNTVTTVSHEEKMKPQSTLSESDERLKLKSEKMRIDDVIMSLSREAQDESVSANNKHFFQLPQKFFNIPRSQNELASLVSEMTSVSSRLCVKKRRRANVASGARARASFTLGLCGKSHNTSNATQSGISAKPSTTTLAPETSGKLMTSHDVIASNNPLMSPQGIGDVRLVTQRNSDVVRSNDERDVMLTAAASIGVERKVDESMLLQELTTGHSTQTENDVTYSHTPLSTDANTAQKVTSYRVTFVTSLNHYDKHVNDAVNLYSPLCVDDVSRDIDLSRELLDAVLRENVSEGQEEEGQCWQNIELHDVTTQLFNLTPSQRSLHERDVIESARFNEHEEPIATQRKLAATSDVTTREVSSDVRSIVCRLVHGLRSCLDTAAAAKLTKPKHDVIKEAMMSYQRRNKWNEFPSDVPEGFWFY